MKKIILTFCTLHFMFLTSYSQSGSLDNTFGNNGRVTTDFGNADNRGSAVTVQNDGKIIVAGSAGTGSPNYSDFALVRYNTNGSMDNTFGSGGKVATDFGSGTDGDEGASVAIQSDGKIIVGGTRSISNNADFALARYNTNGSLDNTFGTNGKVVTPVGNSDDFGLSVAVQSDGKIIIAGTTYNSISSNRDLALVRYNTDGSMDNTFGTGGKVITVIGGYTYLSCSIAIQSDGKIVLTGANTNFIIARYNSSGSLDNTFGSGGLVSTAVGSDGGARSVALQSDGKIVVTGISYNGTQDVFALLRCNSNGSLDNTFGSGGIVTTAIGTYQDDANSVAIQNDGKIIVAGYTRPTGGGIDGNFALVRYNSNGNLDNTFGSGGIDTTDFGMDDGAKSVTIQSDGKIVVAGTKAQPYYFVFAVARYNNSVVSTINESVNETELSIYPNPTSGVFTLNVKNNTAQPEICVHDVLGNCILNKTLVRNSNYKIDLSSKPKGIYFVEITCGKERTMKKIMLE